MLHWAALGGHTELLKQLVLLGACTEIADSGGFVPLHCAAGVYIHAFGIQYLPDDICIL